MQCYDNILDHSYFIWWNQAKCDIH